MSDIEEKNQTPQIPAIAPAFGATVEEITALERFLIALRVKNLRKTTIITMPEWRLYLPKNIRTIDGWIRQGYIPFSSPGYTDIIENISKYFGVGYVFFTSRTVTDAEFGNAVRNAATLSELRLKKKYAKRAWTEEEYHSYWLGHDLMWLRCAILRDFYPKDAEINVCKINDHVAALNLRDGRP